MYISGRTQKPCGLFLLYGHICKTKELQSKVEDIKRSLKICIRN
ncbi:MAG: hypothetical protein HY865_09010 [Chloroflexi bacterium]|nr:hypothetical protein [Chloroflexota bacterium]